MNRRRMARCGGLLAAAAVPLAWLSAAPAQGAVPAESSGTRAVTIADTAEAWFAASPVDVCTTPLGCPPEAVPTSPYPADTLPVGVAGGQETARTYLVPDLAGLPVGATPVAGTMTLPIATGTTDGTTGADTAVVRACLTTQPVPDGAAGSTTPAPAVDCSTATTVVYDAKRSVMTVDLDPFFTAWANGHPRFGIALVPGLASAQPTDAWHVTVNGRHRAGTPHVSSLVTVQVAPDAATPSAPAAPQPPAAIPAPAAPLTGASVTTPLAAPPVVAGGLPPAAMPSRPVAFSTEFHYPAAFLLPLVLLVGAVFLGRLFTRDATPMRATR